MEFINFKTLSQLNSDIYKNIHLFSDIDIVCGIPRSGLLPATVISLILNLQLTDLQTFIDGKVFESGFTKKENIRGNSFNSELKKNVLIVDDSCYTGRALSMAKKKIEESGLDKEYDIKYLTCYVTSKSKNLADYYLDVVEWPRLFEWNFLHHELLGVACCDIDGVLNLDPTPEENDDSINYLFFLNHSKQKLIPTRKIGYLVTSRLEKYRQQTEKWLEKHKIQYNKLIMLDGYTAEQRRQGGIHAQFKASVYSQLRDATWFIESNIGQAQRINELTGKPVYCTQNQKWYNASNKRIIEERKREKRNSICYLIKNQKIEFLKMCLRKAKRLLGIK